MGNMIGEYMFNVNDRVQRQEGKILKRGVVVQVERDVICCRGSGEHVHEVVCYVVWDGEDKISHAYLPRGIERETE